MSTNTVLLIDDDPDTRSLLKHYLEGDGYAVLQASDGTSGLELAQARQPDLILLDLALPSGNGLTVLHEIRQPGPLQGVPVIVVTSLRSSGCRTAAIEAKASDFLPKPIDRDTLVTAVRNCIRAAGNSNPTSPAPGP